MAISLQVLAKYYSALSGTQCEYRVYNTQETIAIGDRLQAIQGTTHSVDDRGAYIYLNGNTDKLENPIKGSSLEMSFKIDQNKGDYSKWIDFRDDLIASEEGKYIVAYFEDSAFKWGGFLQHDNIREVEQSPITMLTLYAVDGLGKDSLGGYPYGYYDDSGGSDELVKYTDSDVRLTTVVQRCLQHLPHLELYSEFNANDVLFSTDVYYYENSMPDDLDTDDPMYLTSCDSLRFLKIDNKSQIVDVNNSWEVLSEVCRFFAADIRQSNGRFEIVSIGRRAATNLRLKNYDATTEAAVSTETFPQQVLVGNTEDVVQYVDPERYLLPPVRRIKFYHKKSDYYANSLIVDDDGGSTFTFGAEQSMGFVTANGVNTIQLTVGLDLFVNVAQTDATVFTNQGIIWLLVTIKCGTKYLINGASSFEYEWSSTPSPCIIGIIGGLVNNWNTFEQPLIGMEIEEEFNFQYDSGNFFPPFPEDGELTIEYGFVIGQSDVDGDLIQFPTSGGGVTYNNDSTEGNTTGLLALITDDLWYQINLSTATITVVESGGSVNENADTVYVMDSELSVGELTNNTKVLELQDAYLTGGQNVDNTKVVKIWNGSAWVFSQLWQFNAGGTDYTYDKILLYDWLRWQSESVERYQMTLHMRSADVKFGMTLKVGTEIFVMVQGYINTSNDTVTGQWIKLLDKAPIIRNDVLEPPSDPIIKGDIIKNGKLAERIEAITRAKWNNESINVCDYVENGTITSITTAKNWVLSDVLDTGNVIRVIRATDLTYEDFEVSAKTAASTNTISVTSKSITEDIPRGSYIIFQPEYFAKRLNT